MVNGWGGADPVEAADLDDYELGTQYRANADVTLTHARVWTGAGEVNLTNRRARVWSLAGSQLGIATLPDDLAPGWSTHAYDTPIEITSGTGFIASFSTGGNEGALPGALTASVGSSDGNLTAVAAAQGVVGNGLYHLNAGTFPNTGSGNQSFYGSDVVFTVGVGGNTAPTITVLTATAAGADVTATVAFTDAETSVGATTRFTWGDDTPDTVVTYPATSAQHTYSESGLYAVLATVADADGAADHAAAPVLVTVPDSGVNPLDPAPILDLLVSHAMSLGLFERVNQHDLPAPPGHGLHCAVWVDGMRPFRSGLSSTSVRLAMVVRIFSSLQQDPPDQVDPDMISATATLMSAYSGDFSLGSTAREIDLLGSEGEPMAAQAGYLRLDSGDFRVMTITVPILLNDVWEQVA